MGPATPYYGPLVAVAVTFLLQAGAAVWLGATLTQIAKDHERRITKLEGGFVMLKLLRAIGLAGFLLMVGAHALNALQAAAGSPDPFSQALAYVGALATSALLGVVKKLDTTVTNSSLFRKLQPVVVLGGAVAMPWIVSHTGLTVDPQAFASAPLATVATVTVAELLSLFLKKPAYRGY